MSYSRGETYNSRGYLSVGESSENYTFSVNTRDGRGGAFSSGAGRGWKSAGRGEVGRVFYQTPLESWTPPLSFFTKEIKFLAISRLFLTLFRPQNRGLFFYYPPRSPPFGKRPDFFTFSWDTFPLIANSLWASQLVSWSACASWSLYLTIFRREDQIRKIFLSVSQNQRGEDGGGRLCICMSWVDKNARKCNRSSW